MGQLKSAIYARMEEVSFRSGVALAGGVLAAAGVAVALTVVLGGHGDAAASAPASPAAASSAASSSPVPASSSPRATPRPSDTTVPATVAGEYRPRWREGAGTGPTSHRAALSGGGAGGAAESLVHSRDRRSRPVLSSYGMNAAFMSFQPRESVIHAVRPGAGEARVTEVRSRTRAASR